MLSGSWHLQAAMQGLDGIVNYFSFWKVSRPDFLLDGYREPRRGMEFSSAQVVEWLSLIFGFVCFVMWSHSSKPQASVKLWFSPCPNRCKVHRTGEAQDIGEYANYRISSIHLQATKEILGTFWAVSQHPVVSRVTNTLSRLLKRIIYSTALLCIVEGIDQRVRRWWYIFHFITSPSMDKGKARRKLFCKKKN